MPYIKPMQREAMDILWPHPRSLDREGHPSPAPGAGELNYLITKLCTTYLKEHGESYSNHNLIIGVLECAKLEFYRRAVAHYEDLKKEENGDVYN